mmetsp:Transcript_20207/g.29865  ORF Transcript_20207/g.29865 Transcript_20207/m.29865 type:complete len:82 (+) Transcript_20207:692-937(+)
MNTTKPTTLRGNDSEFWSEILSRIMLEVWTCLIVGDGGNDGSIFFFGSRFLRVSLNLLTRLLNPFISNALFRVDRMEDDEI